MKEKKDLSGPNRYAENECKTYEEEKTKTKGCNYILGMNFLLQTSSQYCIMVDTCPICTICYTALFRTTGLAPF